MPIMAFIPDEEPRLMRKKALGTLDKNYARRLLVMLMLHQGITVDEVAKTHYAARSPAIRWVN
ncbi:TPA: hypothetical protein P0N89_004557 [Yersinia enterocolitica]|nr:hypothetical protein [Yersinia enterocolitica]